MTEGRRKIVVVGTTLAAGKGAEFVVCEERVWPCVSDEVGEFETRPCVFCLQIIGADFVCCFDCFDEGLLRAPSVSIRCAVCVSILE